jgi:agmatine deiminase
MPEVRKTFLEYIRTVAEECGESAFVLTNGEKIPLPDNAKAFDYPTNDVWCRDYGPTFLKNDVTGELAVAHFTYNAWGGKFPPWDNDARIPERIAETFGLRRFEIPIVCEGGALEVNGEGTLITTESVILNANRNPGMSKQTAEKILCDALGCNNVIWLESGLAGDDTDGHVDTQVRFFRKDAVIMAASGIGENVHVTRSNRAVLESAGLEIVELPCPPLIPPPEGWREEYLPATYANFLITNKCVLVPVYGFEEEDARALEIIGKCYPAHKIKGINCRDIILEGGALHCLSQQMPL